MNQLTINSCLRIASEEEEGASKAVLTHKEAKLRSVLVEHVSYNLVMALPPGEHYKAEGTVTFELKAHPYVTKDLFIDFEVEYGAKLNINNISYDIRKYVKNNRIYIPANATTKGKNTVHVFYVNSYK